MEVDLNKNKKGKGKIDGIYISLQTNLDNLGKGKQID